MEILCAICTHIARLVLPQDEDADFMPKLKGTEPLFDFWNILLQYWSYEYPPIIVRIFYVAHCLSKLDGRRDVPVLAPNRISFRHIGQQKAVIGEFNQNNNPRLLVAFNTCPIDQLGSQFQA